jgi:hypothetical protein
VEHPFDTSVGKYRFDSTFDSRVVDGVETPDRSHERGQFGARCEFAVLETGHDIILPDVADSRSFTLRDFHPEFIQVDLAPTYDPPP